MSKALLPIFAIAAIGSGSFAVYKMKQFGELEGQLSGLNARILSQEKLLSDAEKKLRDAAEELTTLRDNVARLTKERDEARSRTRDIAGGGGRNLPGGAAPGGDQRGDMRALFQGFARQMDDPEVRKMMKSGQERMITGAYEALFKKLNLSEEDSKLVAELLADRNMTAMDQGRKLLSGKADDASMAAVRKEVEATKAATDAKLKGMLGEEKFSELTAYEQTVGDQRSLDGIARSLERKQMGLDAQQRESLSNIMREERLKMPATNEIPDLGGGPGMSMLMSDTDVKAQQQQEEQYQNNVLTRASQAGLSPDQVNGLRDSFKERNERRQMGRVMGRAFLGGGAPAPAAPPTPAPAPQ